ncbi:hypothetical protein HK105_206356 [Polyrhizophydium stewartii]|uniref:Uncharacterized protein n=1 Tax=Polyrhizophydium stewartii TaxID=2732419 RepID=A0ABR4N3N8_9FUNG
MACHDTSARAVRFRPDATNEWDRVPAEIQNKILAHAGVPTVRLNGRVSDTCTLSDAEILELLQHIFEHEWQGDFATMPQDKIQISRLREPFRSLRTCSMHARVKLLGLKFLENGLDQAAILNMWTDLVDFDSPKQLGYTAAQCGGIAMLQHFVDERKVVSLEGEHARLAGLSGQLGLLKWLAACMPEGS